MRYLTIAGLLFLLVGGSGASGSAGAAPVVDLRVPPFPQDLDLRSVERLYKSAAFKVAVRRHAAKADANANVFKQTFVFETRNGWVIHDYFNKNPNRRRDVLSPAERVGHTPTYRPMSTRPRPICRRPVSPSSRSPTPRSMFASPCSEPMRAHST
jgi:hypothetical protein